MGKVPASDKFYEHMVGLLLKAETRMAQDALLDIWIDSTTRATEWDADQWGFDPDTWCLNDRTKMEARIAVKAKKSAAGTP